MGLLQDPVASLEQASWYLENKHLEIFPGAFELAAGNLCRQTLEQVLFILCFYSSMPINRYLKPDRTLRVAGHLLEQLKKCKENSNKTYYEIARARGNRIRKFAKQPRTLNKWRRILNESSHFSTKFRKINDSILESFINLAKTWFDDKDKYLIVGALNEIFSGGRVWATLNTDADNTPGICCQAVVNANNLERTPDGGLALRGPGHPFLVISSTDIPRGRWPRVPVLVQHSVGISLGIQFVNKHKNPVNISSTAGIIESFSSTVGERRYLSQCLNRLGMKITYK
ncbi:MAG: hypothetical protein RPU15_08745 [Candidatus Sedimenticola sp. (ex Thyasira tokunagai)]